MSKFAKIAIICVILLILCSCVIVCTAIGKMPFLSGFFWDQKDLGVEAETQLAYDFLAEIGFEDNLTTQKLEDGDLVYSGELAVNREFTSAEVNAWINVWAEEWKGMPFQNPQFIVHPDGLMEGSATISIENAVIFAKELGYTQEQIDNAQNNFKIANSDIPIYIKARGEIVNNEVLLEIESLEVVGYTVPADITESFELLLESILPKVRAEVPALDLQNVAPSEKGMLFQGKIPQKVDLEK